MIPSSACQPRRPDQPDQSRRSTVPTDSYTTSWNTTSSRTAPPLFGYLVCERVSLFASAQSASYPARLPANHVLQRLCFRSCPRRGYTGADKYLARPRRRYDGNSLRASSHLGSDRRIFRCNIATWRPVSPARRCVSGDPSGCPDFRMWLSGLYGSAPVGASANAAWKARRHRKRCCRHDFSQSEKPADRIRIAARGMGERNAGRASDLADLGRHNAAG